MDRFIGQGSINFEKVKLKFKIQYGQIYSKNYESLL